MARAPRKEAFFAFYLSCAGKAQSQSQGTVKLHRVLLSRTILVMVAVHRGFGRRLSCHQVFSTYPPVSVLGTGPIRGSTGIFTCCPSIMPFGLILGPDSPFMEELCRGTLGFSGRWILTNVCVTQADILASASSITAHEEAFL
ncbi:hypothetical protein BC332_23504 [Capsicum chinense]|nr:hypothetical protein BC332_23504 [Capsicum chinense]